jgi:hypothetical protein
MLRWFRRPLLALALLTSTALTTWGAEPSGKLIVHEWGTFTTFSGSNGVHLDFRPLQDNELPYFVANRATQTGQSWFSKGKIRTRVRMETPVTYFYTDQVRTVTASVEFPQGLLTEFYPPVRSMAPAFDAKLGLGAEGEPVGKGRLDWGEIDLLPLSALKPKIADDAVADQIARHVDATLPPPAEGDRYAAARGTDSALVHLRLPIRPAKDVTTNPPPSGDFYEKFLFYRGVGKFDVPVSVTNPNPDKFQVQNQGTEKLPRMLVLEIREGQVHYAMTTEVAAGQSIQLPAPATPGDIDNLRELMIGELVKTGLYPKEAYAMVNTWSSSWFTEEGLRLFYLVPQQVTDKVLPLKITPQPDEQLRVMVGRVEIMPISQERQLKQLVEQSAKERARLQAEALEAQQGPAMPAIPEELLRMGRFAEPALARIREISADPSIKTEVDMLLWQIKALEEAARNS